MQMTYYIHVTDKSVHSDFDTRIVEVNRSHYFCTKKQLLILHIPFEETCKVSFDPKEVRIIVRHLFYSV